MRPRKTDVYDNDPIANAIGEMFQSPNESDSNFEPANVVDGLYFIGRAINNLAQAISEKGNDSE